MRVLRDPRVRTGIMLAALLLLKDFRCSAPYWQP
jgi:hypothetical protein